MLIVCCGGKVYGVMPFGTAMFCALSGSFFIGFIAPVYLLCSFLFTFNVWRLYTAGAVIVITAIRWFLGLRVPKMDTDISKALFAMLALVVETVLAALFSTLADALICGFVGAVFYYFAARAAACARAGYSFRFDVAEASSMCVVCIVFGLACGRASVGAFIIGLAPAMFALLMFGVIGVKPALIYGSGIALGLGLNAGIALMPAFIFAALAIAAFGRLVRPLYTFAAVAVFAAVSVLFYTDPIAVGWNSLMLSAGGVLFCILPKRAIRAVREYFDFDGSARLAVRHYINRTRQDAGNRMLAVSAVFDETARLMNVLSSPPLDYAAVGSAVMDKLCPYCPRQKECDGEAAHAAFAELARTAYTGETVIAKLPEFFTNDCARTVDVIAEASNMSHGARSALRERESEDKAKAIVTERLRAVKDVLEELGVAQAQAVGFDGTAEDRIAGELNLAGVECAQVFCTKSGVTAVVRTSSVSREKICRAVNVCLKRSYEITSLEKTQAAGWSVVTLKKRPAYEAVYARAGVGKDGLSGDSYTFKRIGDKFLAALLDGMGSGVRAGESSGAAVELVECFYRAGFDSQSVIAGVNRFLKLPAVENYSAADVVVCDLDSAQVDIIKIGAPPCYIKTTDTVLRIEGSSLPIGVLDEMRPYVTTKRLYPGQMLILVTDGVSDCFSGDELPEFINGLSAFNPEKTVNAIVSRALDLCGGVPKDDMTAVAFRLFDAPKKKKAAKHPPAKKQRRERNRRTNEKPVHGVAQG